MRFKTDNGVDSELKAQIEAFVVERCSQIAATKKLHKEPGDMDAD